MSERLGERTRRHRSLVGERTRPHRSPGIVAFCTIITSGWLKPLPDTPPEDIIPWYAFVPIGFLCFFNGQYYAQRVIGNYYVRKTQTLRAKGIDKVELHAS